MSHTVESLNEFLEELNALEDQIRAMRKPFEYKLGKSDPNELMIGSAFGNFLHNINSMRSHGMKMRDGAALRRAFGKNLQAAE